MKAFLTLFEQHFNTEHVLTKKCEKRAMYYKNDLKMH